MLWEASWGERSGGFRTAFAQPLAVAGKGRQPSESVRLPSMADIVVALANAAAGAHGAANWWSWPLWSWPGWSLLQALALLGCFAALLVICLQVRHWRRQSDLRNDVAGEQIRELRASQERQEQRRREEHEQSQTPYLSVEIVSGQRRQDDRWVATCRVNADGGGVAYNVILNLLIPSLRYTDAYVIRYLRAPGSAQAELRWPLHLQRDAHLELVFTSRFGRLHRIGHAAFVQDDGLLRIADSPTIEDLYGRASANSQELVAAGDGDRHQ
jgi:hypothetical protein